jgi:hypothetical protein
MRSEAGTVVDYLYELPDARRAALESVRQVILENLPDGVVETMNWGMIAYEIPLSRYPDTYNGQPLLYAALASQKNHMAVYLHSIYADPGARETFEAAYRATGKRMNMGASCVRFRSLDDLPLAVIGDAVAAVDVDGYITRYEKARSKGR